MLRELLVFVISALLVKLFISLFVAIVLAVLRPTSATPTDATPVSTHLTIASDDHSSHLSFFLSVAFAVVLSSLDEEGFSVSSDCCFSDSLMDHSEVSHQLVVLFVGSSHW